MGSISWDKLFSLKISLSHQRTSQGNSTMSLQERHVKLFSFTLSLKAKSWCPSRRSKLTRMSLASEPKGERGWSNMRPWYLKSVTSSTKGWAKSQMALSLSKTRSFQAKLIQQEASVAMQSTKISPRTMVSIFSLWLMDSKVAPLTCVCWRIQSLFRIQRLFSCSQLQMRVRRTETLLTWATDWAKKSSNSSERTVLVTNWPESHSSVTHWEVW